MMEVGSPIISSSLYLVLYKFQLPHSGTGELKDWMVAFLFLKNRVALCDFLGGCFSWHDPALILVMACSVVLL